MRARTPDGVDWRLRCALARRADREREVIVPAPSVGFGLLTALAVVLVILAPVLLSAGLGWLVALAVPCLLLAFAGYRWRSVVVVIRQDEEVSRYVTRGAVGAFLLARDLAGEIGRTPDADLR
ncbi:hypothetical protein [Aeromicrobium piscarium]|uniref:Uncharacterized protein n=1 Tax=Aeromicrobium piscarium TaxID=2590901 RepID=A0A554S6X9_9ACTN|nr:hypothetical protein [Aeromicrobium piscarium]TSD62113.1 hypothetical protein FNM00_13430 [Aeromicrobium piscarium]